MRLSSRGRREGCPSAARSEAALQRSGRWGAPPPEVEDPSALAEEEDVGLAALVALQPSKVEGLAQGRVLPEVRSVDLAHGAGTAALDPTAPQDLHKGAASRNLVDDPVRVTDRPHRSPDPERRRLQRDIRARQASQADRLPARRDREREAIAAATVR